MVLNTDPKTANHKLLVWLDAASSMFPGMPLNPSAKQVWMTLMAKHAPEAVDHAFLHWLENGTKMPMPSDIKSLIEGGTAKEKALAAWTKVVAAMSDVGDARSICFDDPLIHLVVRDMGGWTMMCRLTMDKLSFAGHEFQKRYLTVAALPKDALGPVPRLMSGAIAIANSDRPDAPEEQVVMYGDEDRCELVFQGGQGQGAAVLIFRKPSLQSLGYAAGGTGPADSDAAPKQISYSNAKIGRIHVNFDD